MVVKGFKQYLACMMAFNFFPECIWNIDSEYLTGKSEFLKRTEQNNILFSDVYIVPTWS